MNQHTTKHNEFITVINTLKTISQTITDEQRIGLLQQAVQQFGLATTEADQILKASGLIVGENVNYFEVLGVSIDELENQDETRISTCIEEAHKRQYSASLQAGGLPRPDGRTQEQWRTVLNQARDTLLDPKKRLEHLSTLQTEILQPVEPIPVEEFTTPEQQASLSVSVPEDMVFIPAGEFEIGSNKLSAADDERPAHTVYVEAFYMDKYPVTNAQYKRFLDANPQWHRPSKWDKRNKNKRMIMSMFGKDHDHARNYLKQWRRGKFPIGKGHHPVTHVSWYAAMAYARWIGKRLPTEAEWEKAAHGGLTGQKYPWGDTLDSDKAYRGKIAEETISVGKYPPNNYGLYDIVGNVWEWCLDAYDADYYSISPSRNPVAGVNTEEELALLISNFKEVRTARVLRGGTLFSSAEPIWTAVWTTARSSALPSLPSYRLTASNPPGFLANIGFRCVWDAGLKS